VDKTGFGGRRKLHPEHPVFQCSIFSPSLPLLVDGMFQKDNNNITFFILKKNVIFKNEKHTSAV
jgi:hypothetical protein